MFRDFTQVLPSYNNKSGQGNTVNTWKALKHDTAQHLAPITLPTCIKEHKAARSSVHQHSHRMSIAGLSSTLQGWQWAFLLHCAWLVVWMLTPAHHYEPELEMCQQASHDTDVWQWIYKHMQIKQQSWSLNKTTHSQRCGSCPSFPLETADG